MITVKSGTSDPDVLYLQRFLGLTPDGAFGPKTDTALKAWQKDNGLTPDGIAGPKTWELIMSKTRVKICESDWQRLAEKLGCEVNVLKAIKQVETGSTGPFDSSGRPTILFEAHLFWRNLVGLGKNPNSYVASHRGILSKSWNKALYKGGTREWDRLREAWGISPLAAAKSASYGFPQILGQNFKDTFGFVADCYMSEAKQLEFFGRFLEGNGFKPYLQSKDFKNIARKYNGAGFAANKYDQKLAAAYQKLNAGNA